MNDTNKAEREAFEGWCTKQGRSIKRAIEEYSHEYESTMVQNDWEVWQACAEAMRGFDAADMATASAQGFRDGVASLAASAGSEPVAPDWWRKRADEIEAQVAATGSTEAMRCYTDMRTLLQAAARPYHPEGKAGWKLAPVEPTDDMLRAMDRACSDAMHIGVAVSPQAWAAGIAAAPPLPASEAKEL